MSARATAASKAPARTVAASGWRAACRDAFEAGGRFSGAYATATSDGVTWRAMFAVGAVTETISTLATGAPLPTIVDMVPAATWDEREAADLYGLLFEGHEPLRPLVEHTAETDSWTVPVSGVGVNQVVVGPIHAGIIESGHFRFHVVGERVLVLDLRLFYKHRGLERAAEGRPLTDALPYAQRACGACAVTNAVAYAQACESLVGLRPSRDLSRARTLLLELERLYNHLHDISAICAGVGFAAGNNAFAALKERAMRLNQSITGHRFLFGAVTVGGSQVAIAGTQADRVRGELRELREEAARVWRELQFAGSLQARLDGVGTLAHDDAVRLGAVGPSARASGVRHDTRSESPGLWYGSSFAAAAPSEPTGDVAARLEMRPIELQQTFDLLEEMLTQPIPAAVADPGTSAGEVGIARVESPRGETVCAVEATAAGAVRRLHLRTGSYANWPAVAHATADNMLPDFPLINKSFELCYACVDR
jgi:Ni,Fe-hydrogenase III large subunit